MLEKKQYVYDIYKRYYSALCYFAFKLVKNNQEAEDIVASVFVNLYANTAVFDNEKQLVGYLYKATKNRCFSFLKSIQRKDLGQQEYTYLNQQDELPVIHQMIQSEITRTLYKYIEQLPGKSGLVIKLSFLEGKKNDEIAQGLNLSIQTVKNLKRIGLIRLKELMPADIYTLMLFFWLLIDKVK